MKTHPHVFSLVRLILPLLLGLIGSPALAGSITCPYCGQKFPYPDSDAARIQTWMQNDHKPNCPSSPRSQPTPQPQPNYTPAPQGPSEAELEAERQRQATAFNHNAGKNENDIGRMHYDKGEYELAVQHFGRALEFWPDNTIIQQNLAAAKDQLAAKRQREKDAADRQRLFERDKADAISGLKGIGDTGSGLKGIGSPGVGLKGLDDSPAFKELKGVDDILKDAPTKPSQGLGLKDIEPRSFTLESPEPATLVVNPPVVDARNVPSGLPKAVEASIPQTPAGNRVRKGLQAVAMHDWKVALAWFQDALNQEPNNPELQKLVDFAQSGLNESKNTAPVLSREMLRQLASRDLERTRQASAHDVMMTRKLAEWKSKPGQPMSEDLMVWLLARPRPDAAADGTHWLQSVKEDPRYKRIESRWQDSKDMALMFRNEPGPFAVKRYERELRDFYAAWATEQGHVRHYLELRKSSDALAKALDQIEAGKRASVAAESARWEKDWAKALANPNNRSGLKAGDPEVLGPEARHALAEHLLQVQAIEEATQKRLLDAGHQILTLGKNTWTPSQSSTQK